MIFLNLYKSAQLLLPPNDNWMQNRSRNNETHNIDKTLANKMIKYTVLLSVFDLTWENTTVCNLIFFKRSCVVRKNTDIVDDILNPWLKLDRICFPFDLFKIYKDVSFKVFRVAINNLQMLKWEWTTKVI